ncbi:hypothetical protein ACP2AV_08670 [Aliiroseovarius sp. PTFE2010]|uniref:hypothetical protein n=1 Tax=Aliiroseovarius sp. PTFE2010 TaxID=3417190 RepID=UPI003CEB2051
MKIAAHIGFHATDADQLLASLRKSRRLFTREGIALPPANTYRTLLVETMKLLRGQPAAPETEDMLIDAMVGTETPERLILSYDKFTCAISNVFMKGELYLRAPEKITWLRNCFPSHEVEFYMALRNPATFIPSLMKLPRNPIPYTEMLHGARPEDMRWLHTISNIRAANPDVPLTIWAYEDLPLIWTELLREIAGLPPMTPVMGSFDGIRQIMEPEGMARLRAYLSEIQMANELQLRRVLSAFLDKYANSDALEEEIDLPGWDHALVDQVTETYEDDLLEIARLPGVNVITP